MKELKKDWLTSDLIDFEYKKYIMLAYLEDIKREFSENKLYPYLSDLVIHYQNLISFKENKTLVANSFPQKLTQIDVEKLKLVYQKIIEDDVLMKELEEIAYFAIPHFEDTVKDGKTIYEHVQDNIEISPIGMSAIYIDEGYFFVDQKCSNYTKIYQYQISFFENANEKYRGIHTAYVDTIPRNLSTTFENLKIDLTKKFKELPNPATYLIEVDLDYPFNETILPIAKRLLVKYLTTSFD